MTITWFEIRTSRKTDDAHVNYLTDEISSKPSNTDENIRLKQRIDELILNETRLIELNKGLQRQIEENEYQSKRSDSSSSSNSDETVITRNIYTEQIRNLTNQLENSKKDYADLEEKYEYEKHELQTMIEQLREDIIDSEKTKQHNTDLSQQNSNVEDVLRTKFEFELKSKIDQLHEILDKEYNEKLLNYQVNQVKLENEYQTLQTQYNKDLEKQTKDFNQQIERMKILHEKEINQLNNELDRLQTTDDTKDRLAYTEKEFEQLKHDYYDLNLKQKELLNTCTTFENQNKNLLNSINQLEQDKIKLKRTFENDENKLLNEIKQLNDLNNNQKQELLSIKKQIDHNENNSKQTNETLQIRINNYENTITQYEEYRVKLEENLQKLVQQRDSHKNLLKTTKEILMNKEHEFNQLQLRFDQCEKYLETEKERFIQYEITINNLKNQNQIQTENIQTKEIENELRQKLLQLDTEKCQCEQRLQEANCALEIADIHLKNEIEKLKSNLEQEYNHRLEQTQKQHQHDLQQLKTELEKVRNINLSNNYEEINTMYRTEITRLNQENVQLSQHQTKLIDTHHKQMEKMKKELDAGYNNIINEFQHDQTHLQTRYDQLKEQLINAQQIIEQLKTNLNQFKLNHSDCSMTKFKEISTNENYNFEHDQKNRKDNLQNRLENLVKLLEQSNHALTQERTIHAKQENEYQKTIHSLQKELNETVKQRSTKIINKIENENLIHRNKRPQSVPDFVQTNLSNNNIKSDNITTVEKLRELFTYEILALLRLTFEMIFDLNHRVITAHCMDHIEISIKKQIHNELIRSRNSMIKEIRREILEKMTQALKSQNVPDVTIDKHLFEFDRLLSQMAQDCLDCYTINRSVPTNSSFQIFPQRENTTRSTTKSVECLYVSPIVKKQTTSLTSDNRTKIEIDRRPKSASNTLLNNENDLSINLTSQKSINKNVQMKTCTSEGDITSIVEQQQLNVNNNIKNLFLLQRNETEYQKPNVRALAKKFEDKKNSLPMHFHTKYRTPDSYCTTIRTIINDKQDENLSDQLTLSQNPSTTISSPQINGIRKLVRNGFKLFISPGQQQKRTGK